MRIRLCAVLFAALWLGGCAREREAVDGQLATEIAGIKAIDNHAHPALVAASDRGFDGLPVDNMEPQSDPVAMRPGAWKTPFTAASKAAAKAKYGEGYPAWVLDQIGVETMLANRVTMGASVQPPRFRWVAYADALIFPLDNAHLGARNSDRKAFFTLEDKLRARYVSEAGLSAMPATLAEYAAKVVTATLEKHKAGGAVAEKFEAAYLRSLSFDPADASAAAGVYAKQAAGDAEYKVLQDYLFRYIVSECGRLGMAVHLHSAVGAGGYFDVAGANPLNLASVLDDPALRKTKIVMVHGGYPFPHEIGALLMKPNAYTDFSNQSLLVSPAVLAGTLREWLELEPEKVMFGTDGYPYSEELGWEESAWVAAKQGREALGRALTGMLRDGVVTHARAVEIARMVLRENARKVYGL